MNDSLTEEISNEERFIKFVDWAKSNGVIVDDVFFSSHLQNK